MTRFPGISRSLRTAVVAVSLLAAGCGSNSSSPQTGAAANTGAVSIDPRVLMSSVITSISNPSSNASLSGGWELGSFLSDFGSQLINITNTLEMQKVTYQSTGADGQPHTMTGLLILPKSISGSRPSVPILLYQHGTESYRTYSPSRFLAHMDRPADYPEVLVAAAIAASGYAVAMADYEGLGDSTSPQPYVHGASLALQVIDMLRASRTIIGGTGSPCTWNSQLFLMGYSEGGYVTMTTTRELQLKHAAEFTVTASAPLSGPHDLSGVMRTLMLSDSGYKAPYFLPLLLSGYYYASGGVLFNPSTAMISPYNVSIPPLLTGNTASELISAAMGMVFGNPATLIVPKSRLTPQFIAQLGNVLSPEVDFFRQNDSYRDPLNLNSAWVPRIPMRMYHHKDDELVPYGNSQVAFNAFSTAGAKSHVPKGPGVELIQETVSLAISPSDPFKTVHVGAAFPELSNGWKWIDSFKK